MFGNEFPRARVGKPFTTNGVEVIVYYLSLGWVRSF